MLGEPKGEWVRDSDEEPEGFLGASLVFWDMKRVRVQILPVKKMTFQHSTFTTRNANESPLSEEGKMISRSYKQPEGRKLWVPQLAAFVQV